MRVKMCCSTVLQACFPHTRRDALFVVIFNYAVAIGEFEVMRWFLQRGSACSEFARRLRRSREHKQKSKRREAEAEAETQNDRIATELSVSQYIITTALSPHPSISYRSSFASPPLPIPPPEHLVQVRVRPRKEPPQVLNKIVRRPRVASSVPRPCVVEGMLP